MITTYQDLSAIRQKYKDKTIVFCSGSFDIFHAGHVLFFEECKKLGDIIIVAVGNDIAMRLKGEDRPILNEHVRSKVVDALKVVDYVFIHKSPELGSSYHNSFMEEILIKLHPDKWVVNTDAQEIPFRQELAKKYNIDFFILNRESPPEFENISTSKIIEKIRKVSK